MPEPNPAGGALPADLVGLKEAARQLPSHRDGRRVHPGTLRRWIRRGKLPAWERGGWYFVRLADVAALLNPVAVPAEVPSRRESRARQDWAVRECERLGY